MGKKNFDKTKMIQRSYDIADFRAMAVPADGADDDAPELKRIDGHPAVYDSMTDIGGWYYETIERGAFDQTDFDDVLLCVNHETRKIPLARSRRNNANSTMRIKTDNVGLYFEADIDVENNQEARQLYSSIQRGDMAGMSFIFNVQEESWENLDKDMPTRRIKSVSKVYEVCAASLPAYASTDINARDKSALENAKRVLDNARSAELDNSTELDIYKLKNKILGGISDMKKKLLAMLKVKEEARTALVAKSEKSEDVAELRSINTQLEGLNVEITELRGMVDGIPAEQTPAGPEGQSARTQAINGETTPLEQRVFTPGTGFTTVAGAKFEGEKRSKEEIDAEKRGIDLKEQRAVTVGSANILLAAHQSATIGRLQ